MIAPAGNVEHERKAKMTYYFDEIRHALEDDDVEGPVKYSIMEGMMAMLREQMAHPKFPAEIITVMEAAIKKDKKYGGVQAVHEAHHNLARLNAKGGRGWRWSDGLDRNIKLMRGELR